MNWSTQGLQGSEGLGAVLACVAFVCFRVSGLGLGVGFRCFRARCGGQHLCVCSNGAHSSERTHSRARCRWAALVHVVRSPPPTLEALPRCSSGP